MSVQAASYLCIAPPLILTTPMEKLRKKYMTVITSQKYLLTLRREDLKLKYMIMRMEIMTRPPITMIHMAA